MKKGRNSERATYDSVIYQNKLLINLSWNRCQNKNVPFMRIFHISQAFYIHVNADSHQAEFFRVEYVIFVFQT